MGRQHYTAGVDRHHGGIASSAVDPLVSLTSPYPHPHPKGRAGKKFTLAEHMQTCQGHRLITPDVRGGGTKKKVGGLANSAIEWLYGGRSPCRVSI